MFLRCKVRRKDGKQHRYWSVVENTRVARRRMVQRHVLYLGEINDTQELAWRRSIEVLEGQRADQNSRYTPSVLKAVEAISPRSQVPLPAVMAARIMTAAVSTDCSCAEPSPIRSPTTTSPVAMPTRALSVVDLTSRRAIASMTPNPARTARSASRCGGRYRLRSDRTTAGEHGLGGLGSDLN